MGNVHDNMDKNIDVFVLFIRTTCGNGMNTKCYKKFQNSSFCYFSCTFMFCSMISMSIHNQNMMQIPVLRKAHKRVMGTA